MEGPQFMAQSPSAFKRSAVIDVLGKQDPYLGLELDSVIHLNTSYGFRMEFSRNVATVL